MPRLTILFMSAICTLFFLSCCPRSNPEYEIRLLFRGLVAFSIPSGSTLEDTKSMIVTLVDAGQTRRSRIYTEPMSHPPESPITTGKYITVIQPPHSPAFQFDLSDLEPAVKQRDFHRIDTTGLVLLDGEEIELEVETNDEFTVHLARDGEDEVLPSTSLPENINQARGFQYIMNMNDILKKDYSLKSNCTDNSSNRSAVSCPKIASMKLTKGTIRSAMLHGEKGEFNRNDIIMIGLNRTPDDSRTGYTPRPITRDVELVINSKSRLVVHFKEFGSNISKKLVFRADLAKPLKISLMNSPALELIRPSDKTTSDETAFHFDFLFDLARDAPHHLRCMPRPAVPPNSEKICPPAFFPNED